MESNRWLKAYDGELDMDFPTSLKTNSNTMKTNAKTTKKKKKKPTKNRVAGPNTNANQTNATKTITENDDATSATEPHTTKTNTNKNNVTLTLLPVEILRHIFEPVSFAPGLLDLADINSSSGTMTERHSRTSAALRKFSA